MTIIPIKQTVLIAILSNSLVIEDCMMSLEQFQDGLLLAGCKFGSQKPDPWHLSSVPIESMYGIFTYTITIKKQPNVGKYTLHIHSMGWDLTSTLTKSVWRFKFAK